MKLFKKNKNKNISSLSFEDIQKYSLKNKEQLFPELPGALEITKIGEERDRIFLNVFLKKGQIWKKHCSNCKETILLYKGKLVNLLDNSNLTKAQSRSFKALDTHFYIAEEDTILYVEFNKI